MVQLSPNELYRDERDHAAAEAIKREATRWGWDDLTDSIIALFAARALDAVDNLNKKPKEYSGG